MWICPYKYISSRILKKAEHAGGKPPKKGIEMK
jgi:hypothetical protein